MPRNFEDWISAYINYAGFTEAPKRMHFWTAISTISGALQRKVWLDLIHFKWTPCFYIVLVAPPGIVSKTTTAAIGMDLLREVPGIKFGPNVVTWPALVTAFVGASEGFQVGEEMHAQCALTLESSEFGNLVNPEDREMIDLLITLWDSKQGAFSKHTKMNGKEDIENPWINLIACTTPSWIAGNFPEYMIGGGFTSRCLFVYEERKERLIAYPHRRMLPDIPEIKEKLAQDLEHIYHALRGPFNLTNEAMDWGEAWYARHYNSTPAHLDDDRFAGYRARKQTHLHKLAMILSASMEDSMEIRAEHLALGEKMLTDLEADMPKVFAKIGRTDESIQVEQLLNFLRVKDKCRYEEAYRYIFFQFPNFRDYEGVLAGLLRSRQIIQTNEGSEVWLTYNKEVGRKDPPSTPVG